MSENTLTKMDSLRINRPVNQPEPISGNELTEIVTAADMLPITDNGYKPVTVIDNMFGEELSEIELNFCQRFIFSKDIADAVIHSGYDLTSKKNYELLNYGRKMLLKPSIQTTLKQLQEEVNERANIKKEDYIMWLNSIKLRAEASGQLAIELKAAETIGKAQGLIAPKQVDYTNKIDISFGGFDPNFYTPIEDANHEEID